MSGPPKPRVLEMWAIYDHPEDFPEHWVVRRWSIGPNGYFPDMGCQLAKTIEQARRLVPPGLVCFDRDPNDDPVITETWV